MLSISHLRHGGLTRRTPRSEKSSDVVELIGKRDSPPVKPRGPIPAPPRQNTCRPTSRLHPPQIGSLFGRREKRAAGACVTGSVSGGVWGRSRPGRRCSQGGDVHVLFCPSSPLPSSGTCPAGVGVTPVSCRTVATSRVRPPSPASAAHACATERSISFRLNEFK